MKKIFLLGLIVILSVSMIMSGCAQPEEKPATPAAPQVITWRLHHDSSHDPINYVTQATLKFADLCDKYSNGLLQVKVFGDGEVYKTYKDAAAAIFAGDWEVGFCDAVNYPVLGIPESDIAFGVPMFGADIDKVSADVETFWAMPDGGQKIAQIFASKGATIYNVGVFCPTMFALKKQLNTLADFKGVKIRAPGGSWVKEVDATGATTVIIAWGEVPMALKTGVVDGLITDTQGYCTNRLYNLGAIYVPINLHANFSVRGYLIGNKAWDMLTPELRSIVETKVLPEAKQYANDITVKWHLQWTDTINANAIVYELSADVIDKMKPGLEVVYSDLEKLNPELWAVRKQVSGL